MKRSLHSAKLLWTSLPQRTGVLPALRPLFPFALALLGGALPAFPHGVGTHQNITLAAVEYLAQEDPRFACANSEVEVDENGHIVRDRNGRPILVSPQVPRGGAKGLLYLLLEEGVVMEDEFKEPDCNQDVAGGIFCSVRFNFHFEPFLFSPILPGAQTTCGSVYWGFTGLDCSQFLNPFLNPLDNVHIYQTAVQHASDPNGRGWQELGWPLHLLEDLTSPAHVRNDAHPYKDFHGAALGNASPMEAPGQHISGIFVGDFQKCRTLAGINAAKIGSPDSEFCRNGADSVASMPAPNRLIQKSAAREYFQDLRQFVEENHFSKDSAFVPRFSGPASPSDFAFSQYDSAGTFSEDLRYFYKNGRRIAFKGNAYWSPCDSPPGDVCLALAPEFLGLFGNGRRTRNLTKATSDRLVARAQWSSLGPLAVRYVASVIRHYYDETNQTPPLVGCNRPPVANAGPDQTVECAGPSGTVVTLDGSASSDPDNDPLTYTWTGPALDSQGPVTGVAPEVLLPLGVHVITLTVDDGNGGTDTDDVMITVEDTLPPEIVVTEKPLFLWPPDHRYRTIRLGQIVTSATDTCDPDVSVDDVVVTKVTSDEPENGAGDGNTLDDIRIDSSCRSVRLRAERSARGNGRVYTIHLAATDSSGNVGTEEVQIQVPHHKGALAVPDGVRYEVSDCGLPYEASEARRRKGGS